MFMTKSVMILGLQTRPASRHGTKSRTTRLPMLPVGRQVVELHGLGLSQTMWLLKLSTLTVLMLQQKTEHLDVDPTPCSHCVACSTMICLRHASG